MRQIPVNTPPLALATLASVLQGPSPACENKPRPTIDFVDELLDKTIVADPQARKGDATALRQALDGVNAGMR
jgi:hypothetical protein